MTARYKKFLKTSKLFPRALHTASQPANARDTERSKVSLQGTRYHSAAPKGKEKY